MITFGTPIAYDRARHGMCGMVLAQGLQAANIKEE
jgi:hypothetical protein